jgi:hypothetical protein
MATMKTSPDILTHAKPATDVADMVVGASDVVQGGGSVIGGGDAAIANAPFSPQVMSGDEIVRFDRPGMTQEEWNAARMEEEGFMMDELLIQTHLPAGAAAEANERVINFRVRDISQNVLLGGRQKVKRCVVEVMAGCRDAFVKAGYNEVRGADGPTPQNYTMHNSGMLKYPFSVLQDPRGELGARWLQGVLARRV